MKTKTNADLQAALDALGGGAGQKDEKKVVRGIQMVGAMLQQLSQGKDEILAHITKAEAAELGKRSGGAKINKVTGLYSFEPGDVGDGVGSEPGGGTNDTGGEPGDVGDGVGGMGGESGGGSSEGASDEGLMGAITDMVDRARATVNNAVAGQYGSTAQAGAVGTAIGGIGLGAAMAGISGLAEGIGNLTGRATEALGGVPSTDSTVGEGPGSADGTFTGKKPSPLNEPLAEIQPIDRNLVPNVRVNDTGRMKDGPATQPRPPQQPAAGGGTGRYIGDFGVTGGEDRQGFSNVVGADGKPLTYAQISGNMSADGKTSKDGLYEFVKVGDEGYRVYERGSGNAVTPLPQMQGDTPATQQDSFDMFSFTSLPGFKLLEDAGNTMLKVPTVVSKQFEDLFNLFSKDALAGGDERVKAREDNAKK